jgi:hypothetical protein
VLDIAIAVGGLRKGMRVSMYIAQWTIAQQQIGRVPTVEEAADWWKESHRTWWRRQAEFLEIFDLLDNPAPLASAAIERTERKYNRGDVGSVIADLGAMVPA